MKKIEELDKFLRKYNPFTEECQVVYLMVEIRKILDRAAANTKYPLLRFYCDWIVHAEKDRIISGMRKMMKEIYKEITDEKTQFPKEFIDFISMRHLREELKKFLIEYGLSTLLVTNEKHWSYFTSLLIKILEDQPIIIKNPTDDIKSFSFNLVGITGANCVLEFKQPVKIKGQKHSHYTLATTLLAPC